MSPLLRSLFPHSTGAFTLARWRDTRNFTEFFARACPGVTRFDHDIERTWGNMAPVVGLSGRYQQKRLSEVPRACLAGFRRAARRSGARSASSFCRATSASGTNMMYLTSTSPAPGRHRYRRSRRRIGRLPEDSVRPPGFASRWGGGQVADLRGAARSCHSYLKACGHGMLSGSARCCPGPRASGGVQSVPSRAAMSERVRASSACRSAGRGKQSSP